MNLLLVPVPPQATTGCGPTSPAVSGFDSRQGRCLNLVPDRSQPMKSFLQNNLLGLTLLRSVVLHAGAAFLGHAQVDPPQLKAVQSGRASISLRSSVAAGPKPTKGIAPENNQRPEKPK